MILFSHHTTLNIILRFLATKLNTRPKAPHYSSPHTHFRGVSSPLTPAGFGTCVCARLSLCYSWPCSICFSLGKALHIQKSRERSAMSWTDTASDLCRAVGTERELPETGAGQLLSKEGRGFVKTMEPSTSFPLLLLSSNVIAISHDFTSHMKLISTLIPATLPVMTMVITVHGGYI